MKDIAYYNGTRGPLSEMRVPMSDRSHWFGDGVYDALDAHNHVPLHLEEHIDRIFRSAQMLSIVPPCTKHELAWLVRELCAEVESGDTFVYFQFTRGGDGYRSHTFDPSAKANLWIVITPEECMGCGGDVALITREDTRFLHCNIKTLNLIPSVMAAQAAKEAGVYETVLHRGDIVTECAHSNVHIISDGVLITHPTDNLILPGIGRAHLLGAAVKIGMPTEEREFTLDELFNADEVLVTDSGTFCARVTTVDDKPISRRAGSLVDGLREVLMAEFVEECGQ